jgi:hypothetical protein
MASTSPLVISGSPLTSSTRLVLSQQFVSEFQLVLSGPRGGGGVQGRHFDRSVILLCVRWYLAYDLSLRDLEEMMAERGISVDHATVRH